jgi:hypothetical protein
VLRLLRTAGLDTAFAPAGTLAEALAADAEPVSRPPEFTVPAPAAPAQVLLPPAGAAPMAAL